MENLPLFIALALLAEILGTIGGFGSSLFFVPIAGYFLDFHSVLGVTALFHVSSNLAKMALFRHGFDKKLLLAMGIPAVLFVIAGAYFSRYVETATLELALSVFLIAISVLFLLFRNLIVPPTTGNAFAGGAISGFVAGIIGTGGAVRGVVLAAYNLKMEIFIATSAVIDLGIDASRSAVYWYNGFVHEEDLYLIPILLLVSITGTYLGKRILTRFSEKQFKSIALSMILLTGIVTLFKILTSKP